MRKVKAHYVIPIDEKDRIVEAVQAEFGCGPNIGETSITMRGEVESGLEMVKLSLEEDHIKILVAITNRELLQFFNELLGEPIRIK
ncbi:MAG: hypothetical protein ACXABY_18815 [Candidatus Thorarchaeota archaeon]